MVLWLREEGQTESTIQVRNGNEDWVVTIRGDDGLRKTPEFPRRDIRTEGTNIETFTVEV